jgi:short-subunit dehydrogenase
VVAFRDHVVFITGASSGIGAALAWEFSRQGADVALAARRVERLQALADALTRNGRRTIVLPCDVTRDGDVERAVRRARDELGPVSVAVANAGFGVVGRLDALTLADYRRQFETNVFGALRTVYASLEDLRRTRGRLVIIGSVSGHLALPGGSAYAMSKFALRALAESLRYELLPHGVAVVLISPGLVESEIHQVDNHGRFHPDARSPVPTWLRMSTDRAARHIVHAVARRRREAIVTAHGKAAVFLQRHVPWFVGATARMLSLRSRPEPGPHAEPDSRIDPRRR